MKLWSRPKGGPHALHPLVPPLLHFKIFTHQNLARNHPILTKTVSFHEKKHFFIGKTSFSIFEVLVKTKGGTTCNGYCGPPFGPCQNFHSSKSCSKPSNSNLKLFPFMRRTYIFFILKTRFSIVWSYSQYQRGDHMQCILWSPLWSMSEFSTHQNLALNRPIPIENYFLSWEELTFSSFKKQVFGLFEVLVNTKGGTTCNGYCGPPFGACQNFHSSKSCSKPSDSNLKLFPFMRRTYIFFI